MIVLHEIPFKVQYFYQNWLSAICTGFVWKLSPGVQGPFFMETAGGERVKKGLWTLRTTGIFIFN